MTKTMLAGALAVVALLGGCSSSSAAGASMGPCESVDPALMSAIAEGEQSGVGMKPSKGAAVLSPDFEHVYFIAIKFGATGISDQVGVWASNSLTNGEGTVMAVDGTAKQFTVWPDAGSTKAAIQPNDPAVAAAKACL